MFRILLAGLCALLPAVAGGRDRAAVLVELFTSEGCSSCPPADRLLLQLDARAIVLSEHVDYWDHEGWKDRFSSPAITARQSVYGRRFNLDSVYTPEMVVDGGIEFNGSEGSRAAAEISRADQRPKAALRLARTSAGLRVAVEGAPVSADVFLALAGDSAETQVAAGENKGRLLHHVAVVESMRKIGAVKRGAGFRAEIELPPDAARQRLVVFLQESGQGRIQGAAMLEPAVR
ncbi:MAG: DUF1223 domain-containing protein [Acidobacteriia bacterium]|nr:DUF1223 domain-containing protein [Terriglobia bacterium]